MHKHTDKKENNIFPIYYMEIQMGSGAKSFMRKCFLIYEEMGKYLTIYTYEEAVSHTYMTLHPIPSQFPKYEENFILFFSVQRGGRPEADSPRSP
jgi:hypothetical protein